MKSKRGYVGACKLARRAGYFAAATCILPLKVCQRQGKALRGEQTQLLAREEHHVLGGKRCKMRIKVRVHFTLAPRALTNPTGSIEALFPGA